MQACVPCLFRYHAPWNLPQGIEIATLPEDIKDMSQDVQKAARDDVAAKNMVIYYRVAASRYAPYYYNALTERSDCIVIMGWNVSFGACRSSLSPSILDANLIL
jgi:hypothetical protein